MELATDRLASFTFLPQLAKGIWNNPTGRELPIGGRAELKSK